MAHLHIIQIVTDGEVNIFSNCLFSYTSNNTNKSTKLDINNTRMVQLPIATAAIEYVAAVDVCLIYIISSV